MTQPGAKKRSGARWMRLPVAVFAYLVVLLLVLAALVYWHPVTAVNVVQQTNLRLRGIKSAYARVGGNRVHYLVGGDGPTLLLLHGHPSRALEWAPILPTLARTHRVIAIDFLGYGESDAPDIDYSVATQTAMVMGLLDVMDLAQTDVLGFSMGGWVALKLAAEHPERVSRLVLVDNGGLRFDAPITAESYAPKSLDEFRQLEQLQSDERMPDFVARDLMGVLQEKAWVFRRVGKSALSFRDALDGKLRRVRMPVLILWGKEDRLIPYEVALRLQRQLPQAKLIGLEGCGHLVFWECRDQALTEVLSMLQ